MNCRVQRRLHEGDQLRAEGGGWNIGHHRPPRESWPLAHQSDRCASVTLNRGNPRLHVARKSIPEKLLGLFERTTWPVVPAGTAARPTSQGSKCARMRGMWR